VLIHDAQSGTLAHAEEIFNTMKTEFGANSCHLLVINSYNAEDSPNHVSDVWTAHLHGISLAEGMETESVSEDAVIDPMSIEHAAVKKHHGSHLSHDDVTR
jgi:hypothetical protein